MEASLQSHFPNRVHYNAHSNSVGALSVRRKTDARGVDTDSENERDTDKTLDINQYIRDPDFGLLRSHATHSVACSWSVDACL